MERNPLYPIFLKADQLDILIVGGGYVALEKLTFLFKSSPNAAVSVVSIDYIQEVQEIIDIKGCNHSVRPYHPSDLNGRMIVIGATNDEEVNKQIYHDCKYRNILVNIADNPPLCDFYMGGIVTKGNLKIGISTNGTSPTMAKRLRQFFESFIPDDINILLDNVNDYRKTLKDDFDYKVEQLNKLTESMLKHSDSK